MQRARFRRDRSRAGPLIRGLILAALIAAPALAQPAGYDETFQGCREKAPEDRAECCKSTANECAAECESLAESQSDMTQSARTEYLVACQTECAVSEGDCTAPPGD
jgi:hypothetical protein